MANSVESSVFGHLPDGREVTRFTLRNDAGIEARVINFGGIITHLFVPDRYGQLADIVLGFDGLEPYLQDCPYFGALIGRFGNRIAGGRFELDGTTWQLDVNDGPNHLHGGSDGFHKQFWDAKGFATENSVGVELHLESPDGDQGYPGNLSVTVTYTLTDDNELTVDFHAVTDRATPVNLTQHSYFNLAGKGDVLSHDLWLDAAHYTPVGPGLIPVGEIEPVVGTPFDFLQPHAMGDAVDADHPQLDFAGGYDHNYVLTPRDRGELRLAARVVEPVSGRVLELATEEPCVQFYSGNFLDGTLHGKGRRFDRHTGFCLEPQHFPDSPNQLQFPSTILRPGEIYRTRLNYRFSTQADDA